MWWAIVTASTVGHGEVSPVTLTGRIAATILMFLGLAMIGVLTSSLTTYFNRSKSKETENISSLESKIDQLIKKVTELEDKLPK